MYKTISVLGVIIFVIGIGQGVSTYSFVKNAKTTTARVTGIQELRGPPKTRQKTPIHLAYTLDDGREHSAIAHLPLLQEIKVGDEIRILVDVSTPEDARLPLWSELWARTLAYLVGGTLLLVVARVLSAKRVHG
jgi:hypothetical protein